jgi:hypothetical protein
MAVSGFWERIARMAVSGFWARIERMAVSGFWERIARMMAADSGNGLRGWQARPPLSFAIRSHHPLNPCPESAPADRVSLLLWLFQRISLMKGKVDSWP